MKTGETVFALAAACFLVTWKLSVGTYRFTALAWNAFGPVVVPVSTLIAKRSGEVFFTFTHGFRRTNSDSGGTLFVDSSMIVAFAWVAFGEAGVAFGAVATVVSSVFFFTLTGAGIMIARCVCEVRGAVAFQTSKLRFYRFFSISVVARCAAFTVYSMSIMLAVDAYTTADLLSSHIKRKTFTINMFIVVTGIGVVVTVASFAFVVVITLGVGPFALVEQWKTLAA